MERQRLSVCHYTYLQPDDNESGNVLSILFNLLALESAYTKTTMDFSDILFTNPNLTEFACQN